MLIHSSSLLFFAAALQGFFLAGVLGLHRRNMQANKILAVWIALLSVDLLQQVYYAESWYKQAPQFINVMNFLPLSYGGFLFLYVRGLTQAKPLQWKDAIHFSVFLFAILFNIPLMLMSGEDKLILFTQDVSRTTQIFALLMPLVASIYAVLSYRLFMRYSLSVGSRLSWLRVMLWLNMIIWIVVWVSIFAPNYLHQINNTVIYLLVSLVIYMLGYFSLRQPDMFVQGGTLNNPDVRDNNASAKNVTDKDTGPKYGDNRLPDELREHIWSALDAYIQEHTIWHASNLTLTQLADSSGIASHHISQVLNDHLGLSFNDYINQYRVNAVCVELQKSSTENLLDIAIACGFSSKSSFNAIFKKHTGKTPSEYRKEFQP